MCAHQRVPYDSDAKSQEAAHTPLTTNDLSHLYLLIFSSPPTHPLRFGLALHKYHQAVITAVSKFLLKAPSQQQ